MLPNGKTVLAIIPARGGSKEIKKKNIVKIAGKPLIVWTIKAASQSMYIDRVILSSDDDEIIELVKGEKSLNCDVPFKRPDELATDTAIMEDVVLHALKSVPGYDYFVLLQPTSPLRVAGDIDSALELMIESCAFSCVSITLAEQSPFLMFKLGEDKRLNQLIGTCDLQARRQDYPDVYLLNGAIYSGDVSWFMKGNCFIDDKTLGYIMPSHRSVDIDGEMDLEVFRAAIE